MEGESGVTRSIIDELHSWDLQGGKLADERNWQDKRDFILGISKELK